MSRTARLWKGAGPLALGGLLLSGVLAVGDDTPPPLPDQLVKLGHQALDQGDQAQAASFFRKALDLDPANAAAKSALKDPALSRVAMRQDDPPGIDAPGADVPPPPDAGEVDVPDATLEAADQLAAVRAQRLTAVVRQRIDAARDLLNQNDAESALTRLRLAITNIDQAVAAGDVDPALANTLRREVEANYQSTLRREEEQELVRAEAQRLQLAGAQRARTLQELATSRETVNALMTQFDLLMSQGHYNVLYNGGGGDIQKATAPFYDARILAQQARALDPNHTAPRAGVYVSQTQGFLAQTLMFEQLKEYRFMLTLQDVERASVPFPDTITIEYPPVEFFKRITELRREKYESVDLVNRDEKTLAIMKALDEDVEMPFQNETPLEDVIRYIKTATDSDTLPGGIPIYIDPVGLTEADRTMTSPITLSLSGVKLKQGLNLILKQLGLVYTVKDGLMTITAENSEDRPTEIRVYPVADLSIIPLSLMGGGGGGMMGGGMGGMGGGMGGMGGGMGGMGGMGGGMGGMGGGMMGGMGGGMRSMPIAPQDSPFEEKKSN